MVVGAVGGCCWYYVSDVTDMFYCRTFIDSRAVDRAKCLNFEIRGEVHLPIGCAFLLFTLFLSESQILFRLQDT